jgi:hypothetical protein
MPAVTDSACLPPVVRRANVLVVSEEAERLHQRFPAEAMALGRAWNQESLAALTSLAAAAWETALFSGYFLPPALVEQAVACLLVGDLDGYENGLFRSSVSVRPGVFVDDGREDHPRLVDDVIMHGYLRHLRFARNACAQAHGEERTVTLATFAHRLMKIRQRRRDLLAFGTYRHADR